MHRRGGHNAALPEQVIERTVQRLVEQKGVAIRKAVELQHHGFSITQAQAADLHHLSAGRRSQVLDVLLRGLLQPGADHLGAGAVPVLAAGRRKAGDLQQVALDALIRHKGALPLTAHQQALLHQVQHGFAHGHAAYAVGFAQKLLAGNTRPGGINPGQDVVFQAGHQLLVERALALFFQRFVLHVCPSVIRCPGKPESRFRTGSP